MEIQSERVTSVNVQPLSLEHITDQTPMGGQLLSSGLGATFRIWAPAAREVHVLWDYTKEVDGTWKHRQAGQLARIERGQWAGFVPTLSDGTRYMVYVVGPRGGSEGLKRDPFARDLTDHPMWPDCQCVLYHPVLSVA